MTEHRLICLNQHTPKGVDWLWEGRILQRGEARSLC